MSTVELNEPFLAKIAGWEVVKEAKSLLERGFVLSSNWTPPILKGVVKEGSTSYRAGLVIRDGIDLENMCSCRTSRQWGTICAHSVSVGLHHLRRERLADGPGPDAPSASPRAIVPARATESKPRGRALRRAGDDRGEPLELSVILPPNLEDAVRRGKLMVCVEGSWERGRMPLNALPMNVPFSLQAPDLKLLDCIEALAGGETPGMMMLDSTGFSALLDALAEHPRVTSGRSQSVEVLSEPWRVPLALRLDANGEIRAGLKESAAVPALLDADPAWCVTGKTLRPIRLSPRTRSILKSEVRLARSEVAEFLMREWPALQEGAEIETDFDPGAFEFAPLKPQFQLEMKGNLASLDACLTCRYGTRVVTVGATSEGEAIWIPDPNCMTRYGTRDLSAERSAIARLARNGFTGPHANGLFQLGGQGKVLTFFAKEFPKLEKEWTVLLEEKLERTTSDRIERIEPRFEVTPSGEQWFELDIEYQSSGGEKFSPSEVQRLLLSGQTHTRLKNGRIGLLDTGAIEDFQNVLADCNPRQEEGGYRIHEQQAAFLQSGIQSSGWDFRAPSAWRDKAQAQNGGIEFSAPPLGALESVLRPYQKAGVGWLAFLRANGFGGVLADEMGLGKTVQTLAFLQEVVKKEPLDAGRLPSLIVCPSSLVFNWIAEARKFAPELGVLALHGPDRRELFQQVPAVDLVVTSYALVRRDAELYRGQAFDTVVLDEAQHIKNRQTQNAQAVKAVEGNRRLVLTGTPLENSVLDLWSIFDFLMPGYLGTARDFKDRYELPITRERDAQTQSRLYRRVRPFLMRRLKKEVAADLPEKIEQVTFCDLSDEQRALYREMLDAGRREALNVEGAATGRGRMLVLNALLRLRQICCDLRLLKLERPPESPSGKGELFRELVEEALDGGHRVLVFSQFVQMLHLIRDELDQQGIEYCYLDGSTTNRGEVVRRFQSSQIPIFLISLKAGGVGLNLAAADTVIHFDPWWNPAVEDQATDRAHRIGQSRVVTSYKLITRGTVEEKILNLQKKKRELLGGIFSEEEFAQSLSWDELRGLLAED